MLELAEDGETFYKLKMRLDYFDQAGKSLGSELFDPYRSTSQVDFRPGTRRPFLMKMEVDPAAHSYEMVVVEIK